MKYGIDTNIEKDAYSDEHRGKWSVRIYFEEAPGPGNYTPTERALVEGSGTADSETEAADLARRFTRWAIKAYDLFGLDTEVFDGE